tara:strand:- start:259 stop:768 length:510 start_codon:yes stop_codon:yes gene_type:complete
MSPTNSKDITKKQTYRPSKESKVTHPQKLKSVKIKNAEECIENQGVEYESNEESQKNIMKPLLTPMNEVIRTSDVQEIGTSNSHQTTGETMNVVNVIQPSTLTMDGLRQYICERNIRVLESMVANLLRLHVEKRNITDALRDIFTKDDILNLKYKELFEEFNREYSAFL